MNNEKERISREAYEKEKELILKEQRKSENFIKK